jgi:transmembrane sensor
MKAFLVTGLVTVALLTANIFNDVNLLWPSQQRDNAKHWVYQKYSSQYGEQKQLTLNDGTIVELNTNSVIEVAYTAQQRKITLIRGEARFDVAKDKNRPFTVISGHNSFTALGTIFNVQRENINSVELLVKEGRVLVAKANIPVTKLLSAIRMSDQQLTAPLDPATTQQGSKRVIKNDNILTAGEKVAIANDISSTKQSLSTQEVKQELAWQQGMLIFDGEPLTQVLKEVQRYNQIKFTPINNELAKLRVSGYFKTNDINGLLQSLSYNFDINAQELTSNTYTLSRTL